MPESLTASWANTGDTVSTWTLERMTAAFIDKHYNPVRVLGETIPMSDVVRQCLPKRWSENMYDEFDSLVQDGVIYLPEGVDVTDYTF